MKGAAQHKNSGALRVKRIQKKIFLILCLLSFACPLWGGDVRVCQKEPAKYKYRIELANLILSKTEEMYGKSKIIFNGEDDPAQARCLDQLMKGRIDLAYLPPTEERLKKFSVILTDIHCGMLGFRVFLINKEDANRFASVKTLDDLRKITGGFGNQWADFKIFALNKLPVVGAATHHTLLKMLAGKRFDYFHRGLHEAWAEIDVHPDLPIMVEETIALVYNFPVYYFFNENNQQLKKRFEEGIAIIKKDGSFKKLFLANFGKYAVKADLKNRTIIHIKYPMPEGLPPIDTSLWLEK